MSTPHKKLVTVYLHAPHWMRYDPSIPGVGILTRDGTEIPRTLLPKVQRKARQGNLSVTQKQPNS